jgi:hypothetical protein
LGDFPFALAHTQRAIALDPKLPILKANLAYIQFYANQLLPAFESFQGLHKEHPDFDLSDVYIFPEVMAMYASFKKDPKSVDHIKLNEMLNKAMRLANDGKIEGKTKIRVALNEITSLPVKSEKNTPIPPKSDPNLPNIWPKLIEAVGRVSPFTRSYLVDAIPISFENEIFTIGFPPEFQDHLSLLDNERNQTLIKNKLNELGCKTSSVKFVIASQLVSG